MSVEVCFHVLIYNMCREISVSGKILDYFRLLGINVLEEERSVLIFEFNLFDLNPNRIQINFLKIDVFESHSLICCILIQVSYFTLVQIQLLHVPLPIQSQ